MKRVVLVGLAAIVLLVAVGGVIVEVAGRDAPPSVGTVPAPRGLSSPGGDAPADGALAAPAPGDPMPFAPVTPPGATTATGVIPKEVLEAWRPAGVERRERLKSIRRDLMTGFAGLRRQADECGAQDASWVLSLVATAGAVRVEHARLESRGNAPDSALSCAQSALDGQVIPAAGVDAGRRWEAPL